MNRCAPCAGMSAEEYRRSVVDEVVALLRGEGGEEHLSALVDERERLSGELEFEAAARLRDLISGIERIRFSRSLVSAEGVQAVVAPSTEPGMLEVFALRDGRLVAHGGFEAGDSEGLVRFAAGVLDDKFEAGAGNPRAGADEARVVAAYLRRSRGAETVEAARLGEAADLLKAVERLSGAAGDGAGAIRVS